MVLGAVLLSSQQQESLKEMGVKDSKRLSPRKRESLAEKIREMSIQVRWEYAWPETIDEYCRKNFLNLLEARIAASLVMAMRPEALYIDAPGKNGRKFKAQMEWACKELGEKERALWPGEIVAENHADANYPVVSAASIIAKVERDREIEKLRQQFGDFGSGYPGDSKTVRFLQEYYREHHGFPSCVRRSWQTIQRIEQRESSWFSL